MDLNLNFIHRVYRTSAIIVVLGVLLFWGPYGTRSVLGWLLGALLGLGLLVSVEWSVRRFITPEATNPQGMLGMMMLKALLMVVVIAVAAWLAMSDHRILYWIAAGFGVMPLVIVLKLIGQKVVQATGATPGERRRPNDRS